MTQAAPNPCVNTTGEIATLLGNVRDCPWTAKYTLSNGHAIYLWPGNLCWMIGDEAHNTYAHRIHGEFSPDARIREYSRERVIGVSDVELREAVEALYALSELLDWPP